MNDTPHHTPPSRTIFHPATMWHTFLARLSRPPWEKGLPAPAPLWVTPGETVGTAPASHPYEEVRATLSRYATILSVPMSFRSAANRYSPPAGGIAVHVHAFAVPTLPVLFGAWPRVPLVELQLAHGIPLSEGARQALAPGPQFGRGRLLADGDGHAVGECFGTNLYCLFDLLGQEVAMVPILLRRHLDLGLPSVLSALAKGRNDPQGRVEERLRLLRDETESLVRASRLAHCREAREAYITTNWERVAEEVRFLRDEIVFLDDGVEEMARRIAADTRCLKEGRRRLRLLQGCRDHPEAGGWDLERLQALPEVCEARIQDGQISVTTSPILTEYGGRWYRLGRFRLDLHFNGDVRIVNLTDRIGPYDHPHIYQGRPCLGIVREGIAKHLGEFQFVAATEVLIDFLQTVNPAEWRLSVCHWPEGGCEAARGLLAPN